MAMIWISGALCLMGFAAAATVVALKVLATFNDSSKAMERVCVRVMIMKGLPAHTAAPEEFTPSGISWGAYEAAKRDIPAPPIEPPNMEDEANAEDLRQQAEEAKRIWAMTDENNKTLIDQRLAAYEERAKQRVAR